MAHKIACNTSLFYTIYLTPIPIFSLHEKKE
jgi:hypothetical protein